MIQRAMSAGSAGEREVGAEPVQVDAGQALVADGVVRAADQRDEGRRLVGGGGQLVDDVLQGGRVVCRGELLDEVRDLAAERVDDVARLRRALLLEGPVEQRAVQAALDGDRHLEAPASEALLKRGTGHGRYLGVD